MLYVRLDVCHGDDLLLARVVHVAPSAAIVHGHDGQDEAAGEHDAHAARRERDRVRARPVVQVACA